MIKWTNALSFELGYTVLSLRDWLLPMLMNGQVVSTSLNNQTLTSLNKQTSTSLNNHEVEKEWRGLMAAEPEERYGNE